MTARTRCAHPYTSDVFSRRLCDDCGADRTPKKPRVTWEPTCGECRKYTPTQMFPPHDASARCESGRTAHCSCRGCF